VLRLTLAQERDVVAVTADGLAATKELMVTVSPAIGDMKVANREIFVSLSDLYRYVPGKDATWDIDDDGIVLPEKKAGLLYALRYGNGTGDAIGKPLARQKIPFGSSRRRSPVQLRFMDLDAGYIELDPPDVEDVAEMMCFGEGAIVFRSDERG
jgi:hypothetical protein